MQHPALILAAGMQKAGTGWFFNLLNDLLVAAGWDDAFEVRDTYRLGAVLKGSNCYLGTPRLARLLALRRPLQEGRRFAVKTHRAPNLWVRALHRAGVLRPIYLYRDPRDVVLSAYAHGERSRAGGEFGQFGRVLTIEHAIDFTVRLLPVWRAWTRHSGTILLRYEDLPAQPQQVLAQVRDALALPVADWRVHEIVARYETSRLSPGERVALHFDKGESGRWRFLMSPAQIALCRARFGAHLARMGYSVE